MGIEHNIPSPLPIMPGLGRPAKSSPRSAEYHHSVTVRNQLPPSEKTIQLHPTHDGTPSWNQLPIPFHSPHQESPLTSPIFASRMNKTLNPTSRRLEERVNRSLNLKSTSKSRPTHKSESHQRFPFNSGIDTFRNGPLSIAMFSGISFTDSPSGFPIFSDLSHESSPPVTQPSHSTNLDELSPRALQSITHDFEDHSVQSHFTDGDRTGEGKSLNLPEINASPDLASTLRTSHRGSGAVQEKVQAPLNASDWAIEIQNRVRGLISELHGEESIKKSAIYELRGVDAQCMVDLLNKLILSGTLDSNERRHTLRILCKIAKRAQVYPRSCELAGVHCSLTRPMNEGGFGCIYKGTFRDKAVCVKAVRIYARKDNRRTLKAHAGELALWAHIAHCNILPFYGVYLSDEAVERICIVSPWMDYGDLLRYLNAFPESPRIPLISDIISGLRYLHSMDIIHADLKASNVLISGDRRAMLADFGISHISMTLATTTTRSFAGTANWTAPELLLEEEENEPTATKKSDIWSFACTCYEVLTGEMPFYHVKKVVHLIRALMRGVRPIRTTLAHERDPLEEQIWALMERCWDHDPDKRPDAEEIEWVIHELDYVDDRPPVDPSSALSYSSLWEAMHLSRVDVAIDYNRILAILHQIEVTSTNEGKNRVEAEATVEMAEDY